MRSSEERRLHNALDACQSLVDEVLDLVAYAKQLTRGVPTKLHQHQFEGLRQRAIVETEYFAQRLAAKLQYFNPKQESTSINLFDLQTKLTAWKFLLAEANSIFQAMHTAPTRFIGQSVASLDVNWRALKCTLELETTLMQLPQVRRRSLTRRLETHQPWLDWQYDYNSVRKSIVQQQQRALAAIAVSLLCAGSYLGKAVLIGLHYLTGRPVSDLWTIENATAATIAACFLGLLAIVIITTQASETHDDFAIARVPQPEPRNDTQPTDVLEDDEEERPEEGRTVRPTYSLYSLRSIDSDVRHTVATKSHSGSSDDGGLTDDTDAEHCPIDDDLQRLALFSQEPPSEMTDGLVRVRTPSPRRLVPRGSFRIRCHAVPSAEQQRAAVEELFRHCDGRNWKRSNCWRDPLAPLSAWHGLQADRNDNVTALYLYNNGLRGEFPTAILNKLVLLQECCLWGNEITGTIGDLSAMQNLRVLSLGGVNGGLPLDPSPLHHSLSSLINLRELSMAHCNLCGPLPDWLSELNQLQKLVLFDNNIEGPLPPKLFNSLVWLTSLDLSDNKLTGEIPLSVSRLGRLQELRLSGNNLCGALPESMTKLTALEHLYLGDNNLTGLIPSGIAEFPCLRELSVENTGLEGLDQLASLVEQNLPNCVIYT